uniref:Predicted protein n=1 Tax=Hordeum vulgare subsp. vulgare TaxID=112509 RepID=F2D454_HORVV|nr:predicted protein [Hordeum vulgare subsp. vulgare]BAJ90484.1 predicted protein [Hordeum vulgare subsp. vulgare]BAJ91693.1 predicted protein [Hordeum vulgare subsp. vulgare]
MALSLLNPAPSRIALKAAGPPPLSRSFLLSTPRLPALLLRSRPPGRVQSSSAAAPSAPTDGSPTPPSSREEAVAQARSCLATALRKPLNNSLPARKGKKQQRQPRFRAEIPVVDDSPGSLARLAFDVFSGLGVSRKGSPARLLLVWPSAGDLAVAVREFESWGDSSALAHAQLDSVAPDALGACDAAVFIAPGRPQVEKLRAAVNALDPKAAVLFNPGWSYEVEEEGFGGIAKGFVGSFNVVYSFMGLEVKGLLSKKKGVLLRCVEGGRFGGESWVLMMEDEEKEPELKVVSRMKRRPTTGEVENMMYNLMAANSPVTKSARFLRELVSNVTGRKGKE